MHQGQLYSVLHLEAGHVLDEVLESADMEAVRVAHLNHSRDGFSMNVCILHLCGYAEAGVFLALCMLNKISCRIQGFAEMLRDVNVSTKHFNLWICMEHKFYV